MEESQKFKGVEKTKEDLILERLNEIKNELVFMNESRREFLRIAQKERERPPSTAQPVEVATYCAPGEYLTEEIKKQKKLSDKQFEEATKMYQGLYQPQTHEIITQPDRIVGEESLQQPKKKKK